jgi:hypothetical protein
MSRWNQGKPLEVEDIEPCIVYKTSDLICLDVSFIFYPPTYLDLSHTLYPSSLHNKTDYEEPVRLQDYPRSKTSQIYK